MSAEPTARWLLESGAVASAEALVTVDDVSVERVGGLVTTCGLENVGVAREGLPFHGSHHSTPAIDVSWHTELVEADLVLTITGSVPAVSTFGHRLELRRTITAATSRSRLAIQDRVVNLGYASAPVALAEDGVDAQLVEHRWAGFGEGVVRIRPPGGTSASVRWSRDTLPRLFQWWWPAPGGYVLAVEPSTSPLFAAERTGAESEGRILAAGDSVEFSLQVDLQTSRRPDAGADRSAR